MGASQTAAYWTRMAARYASLRTQFTNAKFTPLMLTKESYCNNMAALF